MAKNLIVYYSRKGENYWNGKKVMALMTHEGSGLGSSERDLKKICSGATFGKGLAVHGADASKSESTVAAWAKTQQKTYLWQ